MIRAAMVGALLGGVALAAANTAAAEDGTPAGIRWSRTAWAACGDGAVMIEALSNQVGDQGNDHRRPLVLAACGCARIALPYAPGHATEARAAIETAEKWALKKGATLEQVRDAKEAALAFMGALKDGEGGYDTAAAAVHAAGAAAYPDMDDPPEAGDSGVKSPDYGACGYAAETVSFVVQAASAYAAANPKTTAASEAQVRRKCADIVRRYFPKPPAPAAR